MANTFAQINLQFVFAVHDRVRVIRWIARIWSIAVIGLELLLIIPEGLGVAFLLSPWISFLAMLVSVEKIENSR